MNSFLKKISLYPIILSLICSCNIKPGNRFYFQENPPLIEPDYTWIIIPPNIAPLNFIIKEEGSAYYARFSYGENQETEIRSKSGMIQIPGRKWNKMIKTNQGKDLKIDIFIKDNSGQWGKFRTIINKIAKEPVDPFLSYRLLYPGYESWRDLSIQQRNLENFAERSIIENSVADENCINCHSFNNGKTNDFLFHMRGTLGGTYLYSGGVLRKTNLKTAEMKNGSVYPRWHPSGKYVAFSSNKIVQRFHSADNKKVEVSDLESSLVLYDVEKNEIMPVPFPEKNKYMDTYPEWSPDGKYLYFCRTAQIAEVYDYQQIRYNLWRVSFDIDSCKFGNAELIFDASGIKKSIAFPRISPDGRFIIVTIADYGCFPIWHKEADLYSIDLDSRNVTRLELNSDYTDSYHSWSSNGRWLVFSSKRGDGLTARPYISYIDEKGNSGKPFILPQKNPEFYNRFLKSFNVPEFSLMKIELSPGKIRRIAKQGALPAKWSEK
jgi:Tol biopolymer transport system component